MTDADYLFALNLQNQLNAEAEPSNTAASADTSKDTDYQLARRIQALIDGGEEDGASELDTSLQFVYPSNQQKSTAMANNKNQHNKAPAPKKQPVRAIQASHDDYLNQTMNLVHPQWELVDPTPDIFSMFVRFDEKFFQQRLGAVALEWSKKMYSCAGICYQRGNRFVKEVTIRLSEPLLKLRPRKDLVETLLHEMIHAYCFVLNIREGNGGHGPNFKRIMGTINKVAGTNITVYHSFHDEVAAYRTHIWRCTGICQQRTPFLGYVKRTSNRAPGPNDQWWEKHQRDCGGTFMKVGEPSKPPKPESKAKAKKSTPAVAAPKDDIRNWFGQPAAKKVATGTALLGNLAKAVPPTSYPGLSSDPFAMPKTPTTATRPSGANIKSFGDLNKSGEGSEQARSGSKATTEMNGQGYSLGGSSAVEIIDITDAPDPATLRQIRLERFNGAASNKQQNSSETDNSKKRRRLSSDGELISWESYDDDVMVRDVHVPVIDLSDSDSDGERPVKDEFKVPAGRSTMSSQERTQNIKREVMEDELTFCEDDILLIDDEYDDEEAAANDSLTAATELADQSIIDDLFGEDTLLKEFQRENAVLPSGSNYANNVDNDIVSCPICFEKMKRTQLANHFEGCTITVRVEPPSFKPKNGRASAFKDLDTSNSSSSRPSTSRGAKSKSTSSKQILRNSGYTDEEIAELNLSSSSDSTTLLSSEDELTPRQRRQRNLYKQTVGCPKCGLELKGHQLEAHRSLCQSRKKR
ncbi:DNA-dependent metalloprotease SPRTN [Drosophila teissieri]|uniref:DNA-dependent metalloprotease SPRTN n=1 Tax=Drosophila teissieri TaxID=7243 RepID=UPI001CB9F88B|nr:DNA-dependent metalloprotease SPRTN [Drosophila teissieri]